MLVTVTVLSSEGEVGPGGGECQYEETDLEIFSLFTPTLSSVTHLLHHGQCGTVGGGCQDVSLYSRSGQTLVITPSYTTVIVTCNCQPSLYSCAAREVIILDNGKHTQTSLTTRNATIYTLRSTPEGKQIVRICSKFCGRKEGCEERSRYYLQILQSDSKYFHNRH